MIHLKAKTSLKCVVSYRCKSLDGAECHYSNTIIVNNIAVIVPQKVDESQP